MGHTADRLATSLGFIDRAIIRCHVASAGQSRSRRLAEGQNGAQHRAQVDAGLHQHHAALRSSEMDHGTGSVSLGRSLNAPDDDEVARPLASGCEGAAAARPRITERHSDQRHEAGAHLKEAGAAPKKSTALAGIEQRPPSERLTAIQQSAGIAARKVRLNKRPRQPKSCRRLMTARSQRIQRPMKQVGRRRRENKLVLSHSALSRRDRREQVHCSAPRRARPLGNKACRPMKSRGSRRMKTPKSGFGRERMSPDAPALPPSAPEVPRSAARNSQIFGKQDGQEFFQRTCVFI